MDVAKLTLQISLYIASVLFIALIVGKSTFTKERILKIERPVVFLVFLIVCLGFLFYTIDSYEALIDNYSDMVSELSTIIAKK